MSEEELVSKCRENNAAAQQQLYALHADALFRLAFRYVRHEEEAEDVLITSFTKIFRGMATFQWLGEGSLKGWMRKIVVNESLTALRKRFNFNLTESIDESTADHDLYQLSELEAEDIYRLIANLPVGYRTVFNLFVIEGYSHEEISVTLSISEGTSRSQLFKAKALLKKILIREGYQYGT